MPKGHFKVYFGIFDYCTATLGYLTNQVHTSRLKFKVLYGI